MAAKSHSTATKTGTIIAWIGGCLTLYMLLSIALMAGINLFNGSSIRAEAEAQLARAIDQENKAFCSRFGAGPLTPRFAECAGVLKEIRSREVERRSDPFI